MLNGTLVAYMIFWIEYVFGASHCIIVRTFYLCIFISLPFCAWPSNHDTGERCREVSGESWGIFQSLGVDTLWSGVACKMEIARNRAAIVEGGQTDSGSVKNWFWVEDNSFLLTISARMVACFRQYLSRLFLSICYQVFCVDSVISFWCHFVNLLWFTRGSVNFGCYTYQSISQFIWIKDNLKSSTSKNVCWLYLSHRSVCWNSLLGPEKVLPQQSLRVYLVLGTIRSWSNCNKGWSYKTEFYVTHDFRCITCHDL